MPAPFPIPDVFLKGARGGQPREVLRHMMEALELAQGVDADLLTKALVDAEYSGGSAIGDGVAVVSARVPRSVAPKRYCVFTHMNKAVPFRGVDAHPCDLVFVLVSPDDETPSHLRDLSAVVRTLRDSDFVERLRASQNADRMAGLFRARDLAMTQAA